MEHPRASRPPSPPKHLAQSRLRPSRSRCRLRLSVEPRIGEERPRSGGDFSDGSERRDARARERRARRSEGDGGDRLRAFGVGAKRVRASTSPRRDGGATFVLRQQHTRPRIVPRGFVIDPFEERVDGDGRVRIRLVEPARFVTEENPFTPPRVLVPALVVPGIVEAVGVFGRARRRDASFAKRLRHGGFVRFERGDDGVVRAARSRRRCSRRATRAGRFRRRRRRDGERIERRRRWVEASRMFVRRFEASRMFVRRFVLARVLVSVETNSARVDDVGDAARARESSSEHRAFPRRLETEHALRAGVGGEDGERGAVARVHARVGEKDRPEIVQRATRGDAPRVAKRRRVPTGDSRAVPRDRGGGGRVRDGVVRRKRRRRRGRVLRVLVLRVLVLRVLALRVLARRVLGARGDAKPNAVFVPDDGNHECGGVFRDSNRRREDGEASRR